jgi:murein DD-endopeptidase MepM/ murein hydrolase activator NlpD
MKPFWPVDMQWQVTQIFGANPHDYPKRQGHPGTDFGLPVGSNEYAVWGAKVKFAGYRPESGYGREVDLLINDRWLVIYGHLHELWVKTGDTVKRGDVIGLSGGDPTDGDPIDGMSSGAHLHLEVRDLTQPQEYPLIGAVDPEVWLATDLDDAVQDSTSNDILTVITDYINIRRDPSTNKPPVGKVLYGMDLNATGRVEGNWREVKLWVNDGGGEYLE